MLVLVSYDVSTKTKEGEKRLRQVAKTCLNYGIRVQNSVFECQLTSVQLIQLKADLKAIYKPTEDSLRFYNLGTSYKNKTEHWGAKPTIDVTDPLIL